MAKRRFPSDANKQKEKPKKAAPAVELAGSVPISVPAPKLVAVNYKGKNQFHLDHVHALLPGVNHVPEEVLEKMGEHASVMHLVKSGLLEPVDLDSEWEQDDEDNGDEDKDPPADAGDEDKDPPADDEDKE